MGDFLQARDGLVCVHQFRKIRYLRLSWAFPLAGTAYMTVPPPDWLTERRWKKWRAGSDGRGVIVLIHDAQ